MIAQSYLAAISGGVSIAPLNSSQCSLTRRASFVRTHGISRAKSPASVVAAQARTQAQATSSPANNALSFDDSSRSLLNLADSSTRAALPADNTAPEEEDCNLLSRRSLVTLAAAFPALILAPPSTSASPESPASLTRPVIPPCPPGSTVEIKIGDNCGLGVAIYPDFNYSPGGVGGGGGAATDLDDGSDRLEIVFDPETLFIPPVQFNTTRFLGLPLPPPLKIEIAPTALRGYLERSTGKVELTFISKFFFTAGPLYTAPPLTVETILTTESSAGPMRSAQGSRLDASGKCTLVGVARVPPVNDAFLDTFLLLPTDVVAILPAELQFKAAIA